MGELPRESRHENTENPTFTRRQQTFIIVGARRGSYKSCNGLPLIYHNVIKNTHTAIPPGEDRQPVPMMVAGEEDDLSSPLVQQSSGEHQC